MKIKKKDISTRTIYMEHLIEQSTDLRTVLVSDLINDTNFIRCIEIEFWEDKDTAIYLLSKIFRYSSISKEDFFRAQDLFPLWRIEKIFIELANRLDVSEEKKDEIERYWKSVEIHLPYYLYKFRVFQIANDGEFDDFFELEWEFIFKSWEQAWVYRPKIDSHDYYLLIIDWESEPHTSARIVRTYDDTIVVFNMMHNWDVYLYSAKSRNFGIIPWILLSQRDDIPTNILEIWRWNDTLYYDFESGLWLSKDHDKPNHHVRFIQTCWDKNLAVHRDTNKEEEIDNTKIDPYWNPYHVIWLIPVDKVFSIEDWRDIFTYQGEIKKLITTPSDTYVLWETYDALQKSRRVQELFRLSDGSRVEVYWDDVLHVELHDWADDLISIIHYQDWMDIVIHWNGVFFENIKEVRDFTYYIFEGKSHISFTMIHKNWKVYHYQWHNNQEVLEPDLAH